MQLRYARILTHKFPEFIAVTFSTSAGSVGELHRPIDFTGCIFICKSERNEYVTATSLAEVAQHKEMFKGFMQDVREILNLSVKVYLGACLVPTLDSIENHLDSNIKTIWNLLFDEADFGACLNSFFNGLDPNWDGVHYANVCM